MAYRLLVSLGAANLIFVLLFSSFAQQLAQQSLLPVAAGIGSIDRSVAYQYSPRQTLSVRFSNESSFLLLLTLGFRAFWSPISQDNLSDFFYTAGQHLGNPASFIFDSVVPQVKAVRDNGLTNQNASPSNVTGDCPTGNCTWADYSSMGS